MILILFAPSDRDLNGWLRACHVVCRTHPFIPGVSMLPHAIRTLLHLLHCALCGE